MANASNATFDAGNNAARQTMATRLAGEDIAGDILKVISPCTYTHITADTAIKSVAGKLKGIFVSAASNTPTIKLWDNTSAATNILIETFTPVAGTYYPFPDVEFSTGLYADVGGTVAITVFWK